MLLSIIVQSLFAVRVLGTEWFLGDVPAGERGTVGDGFRILSFSVFRCFLFLLSVKPCLEQAEPFLVKGLHANGVQQAIEGQIVIAQLKCPVDRRSRRLQFVSANFDRRQFAGCLGRLLGLLEMLPVRGQDLL